MQISRQIGIFRCKEARMKKFFIALAVFVSIILLIALVPVSRRIDKVMEATEYSFADPNYAVSHSITIQGYDTRNFFGYGHFEGVFSAENWELAQKEWILKANFPISDTYWNAYAVDPSSQPISTNVFSLLPDRKWESFVALLQEVTDHPDGHRRTSFDHQNGRFIVSGCLSREEALIEACRLTKGTSLEPLFTNR